MREEESNIPKIEDERVREAVETLPVINQQMIFMRFWNCLTIDEIAKRKKVTWAEADRLIDESMLKLKRLLLRDYLPKNLGGKNEQRA